jgi:Aldo/keto reductase family
MQYRNLGRTGIKVSPYALGALMFGTSIGNPDHDDSVRVIHKALDAGINLVDTADAYRDSEEVVGKALKGCRDNVVLATKFSRPMGDDPNRRPTVPTLSRAWFGADPRPRPVCAAPIKPGTSSLLVRHCAVGPASSGTRSVMSSPSLRRCLRRAGTHRQTSFPDRRCSGAKCPQGRADKRIRNAAPSW